MKKQLLYTQLSLWPFNYDLARFATKDVRYFYGYYYSLQTADSDTVSTYQVSSVQLVTNKKLEAFNKA